MFAYFPAYSQVYEARPSLVLRNILRKFCLRNSIHFLDLTPIFRSADRKQPLHLAPIDFHPNPRGNRLIAKSVADFLIANQSISR